MRQESFRTSRAGMLLLLQGARKRAQRMDGNRAGAAFLLVHTSQMISGKTKREHGGGLEEQPAASVPRGDRLGQRCPRVHRRPWTPWAPIALPAPIFDLRQSLDSAAGMSHSADDTAYRTGGIPALRRFEFVEATGRPSEFSTCPWKRVVLRTSRHSCAIFGEDSIPHDSPHVIFPDAARGGLRVDARLYLAYCRGRGLHPADLQGTEDEVYRAIGAGITRCFPTRPRIRNCLAVREPAIAARAAESAAP